MPTVRDRNEQRAQTRQVAAESALAVRNLKSMRLSNSTKRNYATLLLHFTNWMEQHYPSTVQRNEWDLYEYLPTAKPLVPRGGDDPPRGVYIYQDEKYNRMVNCHLVQRQMLEHFYAALSQNRLFSAMRTRRSAVNYLAKLQGKKWDQQTELEIEKMFAGLKKRDAARVQKGELSVHTGKKPLSFSEYRNLAATFLKQGKIFGWAYTLITWNLMCRTSNTEDIAFTHLGLQNDAMLIYFGKQKNDQSGRRKDPRHIYANSTDCCICPLTALGVYLLTYRPVSLNDDESLSGKSLWYSPTDKKQPSSRYTTQLTEVLGLLAASGDLYGSASEVGAHSLRKGAATYATSGTTVGPSTMAVKLRGGWSMESVDKSYFRFENAADQYVGRILAGVPIAKAEFGDLPPHFHDETGVNRFLTSYFNHELTGIPDFMPLLRCLTASVVCNYEQLCALLPSTSSFFQTAFVTEHWSQRLQSDLHPDLSRPCQLITATGVPPHIDQMKEFSNLRSDLGRHFNSMGQRMAGIEQNIIEGMTKIIEENGIGAQTATVAQIQKLIRESLKGIHSDLAMVREEMATSRTAEQPVVAPEEHAVEPPVFGQLLASGFYSDDPASELYYVHVYSDPNSRQQHHPVPQDFSFPSRLPVSTAWDLWFLGNKRDRLRPFREFGGKQLARKLHRRMSNWRLVFTYLESYLDADTLNLITDKHTRTLANVHDAWQKVVAPMLHILPQKARKDTMTVPTYISYLRKEKKRLKLMQQQQQS